MLDHLVYAVPDLDDGVAELARLTGLRATPGGRHQGFGTHNALLGLDNRTFLEVIAPDPSQPAPRRPRLFGIDGIEQPRLVGWVFRTTDLPGLIARTRGVGLEPGDSIEMVRNRPDGTRLAWRLTSALSGDLTPTFIDWGTAEHPSAGLPVGLRLLSLTVRHPQPVRFGAALRSLGIAYPVEQGRQPQLIAHFDGPGGGLILD
ncbi:VOC family protein [Allokutzneria sp. A3M-2-11 16]|uniref:VOC family protein n=1 Tax=Allokutzneria sp. A3M-2-11 16 TaxID=2962043 RepID=UPI0020B6E1C1|nr:VOC family protein [Allokutzneria sp. A3M-2-11 16]MCP3802114.1 VOC family protein [Allokutzneria sp. A3M-2-11 16]